MSESVVISKGTDVVNVSISGQGEVNTGQNVGAGAGIFKEKVGADFRYRTVVGGTGITTTQNTDDVTLDLPQEVATDSAVQFTSVNIAGQTTLSWNNTDQTLDMPVNAVTIQLGQETVSLVRNTTGSTIADGSVVSITGSTGNKKTVQLASNADASGSNTVFGMATETIENNADGFVTIIGSVRGLDTSALTEGAPVYLGAAPGSITDVKPETPAHSVFIGYVIKSHATQGQIFVKVQNGYEIEDLHNVLITTPSNNQTLIWDNSNEYWKNAQLDIGDFTDTGGLLTADDLSNNTTTDLAEGTNLYYTDARVSSHLLTMDGSIIPDTDIVYDLGSASKQWRDVYIGPGSLYVNGKKVIEDDAGTITVETDEDQNLRVKTTGTGVTQVTSAQAIQLTATSSADIELTTATGQIELNGDVVIDVTKGLNTSTGAALTVACPIDMGTNDLDVNNLVVDGNLTVSGTTTTVNTETINLADNTILLNSNYDGDTPTENSGIEINRGGGTAPNKTFLWDESSDKWTLGSETLVAGTVEANLTGDVTGDVTGTVSSLSNHTTTDLAEGDNEYYTTAKANSAIDSRVTKSFVENLDIDIDGGTY